MNEFNPYETLIRLTLPENNQSTVLRWDNTELAAGIYFLTDGLGGSLFSDVDMAEQNELIINGAISALRFVYSGAAGIGIVGTYDLLPNYPNPFNPTTTIKYHIKEAGLARLTIFNVLGQEVKSLVNIVQTAGEHTIIWDATNNGGIPVSGGVYIYKLQINDFTMARKLLLIK